MLRDLECDIRGMPSSSGSVVHWLPCLLLVACGSKREERVSPPAPVVATPADASIDAAAPVLAPELRAKWEHGCLTIKTTAGVLETDHARCTTPRRPYSTFKLANALIAVDLGILDGPDGPMTWDKKAIPDERYFKDAWRQQHTLRSAIAVSSVPHFRTLARTIGAERMIAGLAKLDYGNRSIGGGVDLFWLRGDLRISAAEQLAFVDKLARGTLAVSPKAQATVREITALETKGARTLHGKTGAGPATDLDKQREAFLVWQVGWIESGAEVVPYAAWLELESKTIDEARATRDERLNAAFDELGVF